MNTLWQNEVLRVVVNHEEQYSIWPADRDLPLGWQATDKVGNHDECVEYIETVWSDMRPKSLRKAMAETEPSDARNSAAS